jgi:diaminopimelate decarboxylase
LAEIAEDVDTPFYCTSVKQLQRGYHAFSAPLEGLNASIHYAIRANPNLAVIRTLAACGAGASASCSGELERALQGGIRPDKIILSGCGKTRDDVASALLAGISQIKVESFSELVLVHEVSKILGRKAPVSLLVAADPEEEGSFRGFRWNALAEALKLIFSSESLFFQGLSVQVGSTIRDISPYRRAYENLADLVRLLRKEGFAVEKLDLGGGLALPENGQTALPMEDYARIVHETVGGLGCSLAIVSGQRLVGEASVLVTSRFACHRIRRSRMELILDAGMNDLSSPLSGGVRRDVLSVSGSFGTKTGVFYDQGAASFTQADIFGEGYELPLLQRGDLVAFLQVGAYGLRIIFNIQWPWPCSRDLVSGARLCP